MVTVGRDNAMYRDIHNGVFGPADKSDVWCLLHNNRNTAAAVTSTGDRNTGEVFAHCEKL